MLRKTNWLTRPTAARNPALTDQTQFSVALKREGKTIEVDWRDSTVDAYKELMRFFLRIERQESLFKRARESPKGKRHVTHRLGAELERIQRDSPSRMLDYRRFFHLYEGALSSRYDKEYDEWQHGERLVAIRLVAQLQDEDYLETLHRIAARTNSSKVHAQAVKAIVTIEGKAAIPALCRMLPSGQAAWELIRFGEGTVPFQVEVIETASAIRDRNDERLRSAENIVRAYLNNWDELKQGVDIRVLRAVDRFMEKQQYTSVRREYYHKLLKQIAMTGAVEPPEAGNAPLGEAVYLQVGKGYGLDFDSGQPMVKQLDEKGVDVVFEDYELVGRALEAAVVELPYEIENEKLTVAGLRAALKPTIRGERRWPLRDAYKTGVHEISFFTSRGAGGVLAVVGYLRSEDGGVSRHRVKVRMLPSVLDWSGDF
jgi:hypothetical protein